VARNKFKAAINHIKSTQIDEKIQRLNESPTNSMSGVYDLSPQGQRYGEKNPEKIFYANADGSWPPGVPGTPGKRTYIRPRGYWEEGPGTTPSVQHDNIVNLDFSYSTQIDDPRNTKTLIDETTGRVQTELPPNSRSFILGPLVDLYFHNHGYDNRTYVGYIQKDTRSFVLLGYVIGTWGDDDSGNPIRADGFEGSINTRVWDGLQSSFVATNPNFTFEMLQWHHERLKEGKYVKNVSFFNSGGVPIITGAGGSGQPSGSTQGNVSGTPIGGDAAGGADANQTHGSGGNPTTGTPQDDPIGGDQEDAGYPWNASLKGSGLAMIEAIPIAQAEILLAAILAGALWALKLLQQIGVGTWEAIQVLQSRTGEYPSGGPDTDNPYQRELQRKAREQSLPKEKSYERSDSPEKKAEREAADQKIRDAEQEVKDAEKSGNKDRIDRAYGNYENAVKNRQRVRQKQKTDRKAQERASGMPENVLIDRDVLSESRKRILREIKQPVSEIVESKPQKLKKYRPNFKGRFTAQNTPDVTACKESDNMVRAKNAAGQTWRRADKYWGGYESAERLNVIYDHVGHGQLYWDEIVAHNQGKKGVRNRDVQEELNKHYALLAERKIIEELGLNEQETLNAPNDPLIKRIRNKLATQIDYQDKPSPIGYPDGPTPQQVAGYHPEYGKRANYYNALDPKSADAMPPTGDPEIDAKVNAQKTPLLKRVNKIRKNSGKPNS